MGGGTRALGPSSALSPDALVCSGSAAARLELVPMWDVGIRGRDLI